MKILILNWRDPKNPEAGGAEQITEKYAGYWVSKGHQVWWLANQFSGGEIRENREGVNYQRLGPTLSRRVSKNIFIYPLYLLKTILCARALINQENIDVVIDEIHGLPFFTPLYSKARNVLLVCEVAGSIWDKMWPFPVNKIGKFLEKIIYWIYKNTEIWAISQNTKKDILSLNPNLTVKILPLGIDTKKPAILRSQDLPKFKYPSAVFLARLVKMKGIESAIVVSKLIVKDLPDFKLYIIGKGEPEYETHLKNLVKQKSLENNVEFLGFVPEEKKYEILARSHFLLHPSYKEGFGLTVLETGLVGTASIVRAGGSLEELVKNGVEGCLFDREPEMAEKFIQAIKAGDYFRLGENMREKALQYDWQNILPQSDEVTRL